MLSFRWGIHADGDYTPQDGMGVDDIELFEAPFGAGQAPQPGAAVLDVVYVQGATEAIGFPVSSGAPGPYFTTVPPFGKLTIRCEGAPNQPVWLAGGTLDVGAHVIPPFGQLDLAEDLLVLASGFQPGQGLGGLFFTNQDGLMAISLTMSPGVAGHVVTLQGAVGHPLLGLPITNAVQLEFFQP